MHHTCTSATVHPLWRSFCTHLRYCVSRVSCVSCVSSHSVPPKPACMLTLLPGHKSNSLHISVTFLFLDGIPAVRVSYVQQHHCLVSWVSRFLLISRVLTHLFVILPRHKLTRVLLAFFESSSIVVGTCVCVRALLYQRQDRTPDKN